MIIEAAILIDGKIFTGHRHHNIINSTKERDLPRGYFRKGVQGFTDDKGNFLDREQAAKHALECGQVVTGQAKVRHVFNGYELYSEDLY
jgi:hypothetical protein